MYGCALFFVYMIEKYFPALSARQYDRFSALLEIYPRWNSQINVISRKDIDNIEEKHILHSLSIAKVHSFTGGSKVMDIGTGGGFPGIPLAILFEDCDFLLVDSIGKKIKVVEQVIQELGLKNCRAMNCRAEVVDEKFDFIVSRAVTRMEDFVPWCVGKFKSHSMGDRENGILYLKGGELSQELSGFDKVQIYDISEFFSEDFFKTKKVVYLPKSEVGERK